MNAKEEANKAPEPTTTSVTPRATSRSAEVKYRTDHRSEARVVPAVAVAHLCRWAINLMQHNNKVRSRILTALVIAVVGFLGFQFYRAIDAEPFNLRMQRKVESNQLIGKVESELIAVLGPPSHRAVYSNGDFTLNYFPGVLVPVRKFQAHFRAEGSLRSIELMD